VAGAQQITRRPVRLSTLAQYVRAVERMSASARLPHQIGGQARRSYELYRAALLRVAALGLCAEAARWRSHQDGSSGVADLDNPNRLLPLLVHLAAAIRLCRALPWSAVRGGEIAPCGDALSDPLPSRDAAARPRQRRASRSKRGGLGRLPADWREQMLAAWPPGSHWAALPLRALALLGVRPVELTGEGIILHCTADHLLVATVRCAKTRAGSPARTRSITLDPARSHGSAWELVEALIAQPGGEGRLVIRIDCPRRLSDAVRALGRRLFGRTPYQVAPYSLRHQFAADAKAVAAWTTADGSGAASGREGHGRKGQQVGGLPPLARSSDECDGTAATESQRHPQLSGPRTAVAILLGHQSLRSQSAYGTRAQARGGLVHLVSSAPERLVTPTRAAAGLPASPIADVRRRTQFPQS
jgi:hypothetical protein